MLLKTPCPMTRFGRLYAPDPRDRLYPARAAMLPALLRQERFWATGPVQDQGREPHCVGFAVYQFLISAPFMMRKGRLIPSPVEIYRGAQTRDEWEGENYDGTSGRGALKWLMEQKIVNAFHSAQDGPSMRNWLLTESGLMCGTEWYAGMSAPKRIQNSKGQLESWLEPTGDYEGGHETFWYGYSKKRDAYRMINSWGGGWADGGRAWIDRQIAEHLIFGLNGDAYTAIEVR